MRDLFQQDDGGWLQDPLLLDRLVAEKLERGADSVRSEGWKWVEVAIDFPYGHTYGLRRISGDPVAMTDEEAAAAEALRAEYERLEQEHSDVDVLPEAIDQRLGEIETALAELDERPVQYDPDEIARAGAFVSIDASGVLRVDRGYVRPEDEPAIPEPEREADTRSDGTRSVTSAPADADGAQVAASLAEAEAEQEEGIKPIPDRLMTELTAYRTLALRDALAQDPDIAYLAALHALCLKLFYRYTPESCLDIDAKSVVFGNQAPGLSDAAIAKAVDERHRRWSEQLPRESAELWDALSAFDPDSRDALFAHCIALSVNAVYEPWNRRPRALAHADRLDLHPDAGAPGAHAQYPTCLPPTAKKGLFGEVMTGLMTQAYQFIGGHQWTIPVFLFRYHAEAEAYIFDLARDPPRVREISGRHGNDFIALAIDPASGEVVRFIAGEAKWRADLTPSVMDTMMFGEWTGPAGARVRSNDGVWNEINRGLPTPQGLEQMHRLLCEKARDDYAEAIVSLDRALLIGGNPLPRTDLVFVAGNRAARRAQGQTYLPTNSHPVEYAAGRPLQVVVRLGERIRAEPGIGFRVRATPGDQQLLADWRGILGWWTQRPGSVAPSADRLRSWQRFVGDNIEFRLGVAVGAAVAQAWNANARALETPSLQTWRATTNLPWVAFWFRELLRWGTLDPFIAFALSQGLAQTREAAAARRAEFEVWLAAQGAGLEAETLIDPQRFLAWQRSLADGNAAQEIVRGSAAALTGTDGRHGAYDVRPIVRGDRVDWIDAAGYSLASSVISPDLLTSRPERHDFLLSTVRTPEVTRTF